MESRCLGAVAAALLTGATGELGEVFNCSEIVSSPGRSKIDNSACFLCFCGIDIPNVLHCVWQTVSTRHMVPADFGGGGFLSHSVVSLMSTGFFI